MVDLKEHKGNVRSFFDNDENWQGRLYTVSTDRFARAVIRRKIYAIQMIREALGGTRGRALDIGCGSGVYLEDLINEGFEVYGIDFSREMAARVRERLDHGATILCGDVEGLPFKDDFFNLTLCIGVLGYLLADEQALREIWRVLLPGGFLIVNVENMMSVANIDYVIRHNLLRMFSRAKQKRAGTGVSMTSPWVLADPVRRFRYKLYSPWKFERMMNEFGFALVDAMTFGFEFRLLRKSRLVPEPWLAKAEVAIESVFRRFRVPYYSYAGESYTAIFRKQS